VSGLEQALDRIHAIPHDGDLARQCEHDRQGLADFGIVEVLGFIALRTAFSAIFSAVAAQSADRRYLDGMRPSELEDIGLRRTDSRDYTSFR